MPEGPELHLACRFVNSVCRERLFSGRVIKSEVSTKNPDVDWDEEVYQISATSRGKEVKLTLSANGQNGAKKPECKDHASKVQQPNKGIELDIVFRFGMSGKFTFGTVEELHKHAHLNFYAVAQDGKPQMVLSFVDQRRFGRWEPGGDWGQDRGPCVLFEYDLFRENVLQNLEDSAFNKPMCEIMLNQKYFNGIGNYLRAEILYRAGIAPFVEARSVLEGLPTDIKNVKTEASDILQLCNTLPREVINLGDTSGYDTEADDASKGAFMNWLQCYYNPEMKSIPDHNSRTIWFSGETGPMAPKNKKQKSYKRSGEDGIKKRKKPKKTEGEDVETAMSGKQETLTAKSEKMAETNGEEQTVETVVTAKSGTKLGKKKRGSDKKSQEGTVKKKKSRKKEKMELNERDERDVESRLLGMYPSAKRVTRQSLRSRKPSNV